MPGTTDGAVAVPGSAPGSDDAAVVRQLLAGDEGEVMNALPGLDCDQVVELVTQFLEGTLDATTTRRVQEHLASCPGCDTYVEQIRQTVRALGGVPADTLAPHARAELMEAFRAFTGPHADG